MFKQRERIELDGAWSFAVSFQAADLRTIAEVERSGHEIRPCRVPGNLELDLQAAGEIPEPFHGMNIAALCRYEAAHAWYFRRFDAALPPDTTPVLVFDGLDCFADVYLNGEHVGSSANALVEHVFSAGKLRAIDNELVVHLRPVRGGSEAVRLPAGRRRPAEFLRESLRAQGPARVRLGHHAVRGVRRNLAPGADRVSPVGATRYRLARNHAARTGCRPTRIIRATRGGCHACSPSLRNAGAT